MISQIISEYCATVELSDGSQLKDTSSIVEISDPRLNRDSDLGVAYAVAAEAIAESTWKLVEDAGQSSIRRMSIEIVSLEFKV
jgi:hypothetical protein